MNLTTIERPKAPVILVVQNRLANLATDSDILNSFNTVYIAQAPASQILQWIQQNQPDLIILDLPWSEIMETGLIAALRLDWLTRDIPAMVLSDRCTDFPNAALNIDYNACLCKPYSTSDLERLVCSLVSIPACLSYAR